MAGFIPATSWSLLPPQLRLGVMKELSITNRIAVERVDKTCGALSKHLFSNQEFIPCEDDLDDGKFNYLDVVKRCSNLKVFDFKRNYRFSANNRTELEELFNELFNSHPNIRSFPNITVSDVRLVAKYLKDYRRSSGFGEKPFGMIDTEYILLQSIRTLYRLVDYRIKLITFPHIGDRELPQWLDFIDMIPGSDLISLVDFMEGPYETWNIVSKKILEKPGLKLKRFAGYINQNNFKLMLKCKSSITSLCIIADEEATFAGLEQFENLKHLKVKSRSLTKLDVQKSIELFLKKNGHKLRTLTLHMWERYDLLDTIARYCSTLEFLDVADLKWENECDLTRKNLNQIASIQSLKFLIIDGLERNEDYQNMLDAMPRLISIKRYLPCRCHPRDVNAYGQRF